MEKSALGLEQISTTSRRLVQRLFTIGENRLDLVIVELQEERERLLQAFILALGVAATGLLAGIAFTAALVILLWAYSPALILLLMAVLYGTAGFCLWRRLTDRLHEWHTLSATLDQLRKDRVSLEKALS